MDRGTTVWNWKWTQCPGTGHSRDNSCLLFIPVFDSLLPYLLHYSDFFTENIAPLSLRPPPPDLLFAGQFYWRQTANCILLRYRTGCPFTSTPTVRKRRVRERKGEREMEIINKIDKNQINGLFYWQVSASFSCSSSSNPPQAHFIGIFMKAEQPLDQFSRSPSLSRDNKLIRNCLLIINYDRNRFPASAKGNEERRRGTNKYRSIIIELKEPPPPPLAPVQEQDHPG